MPSSRSFSRRDALVALGSAATVSLAGCVDAVHAPAVYCQNKGVSVTWTHEGTRYGDQVVLSSGYVAESVDTGKVRTRVAEEFSALAGGPRDVVVRDDAADALARTFSEVRYILGFCGDALKGCLGTDTASRADFNAVQVGDRARVTLVDRTFSIHSVEEATVTDDWDIDYLQFDFSERHADDGVPLAD